MFRAYLFVLWLALGGLCTAAPATGSVFECDSMAINSLEADPPAESAPARENDAEAPGREPLSDAERIARMQRSLEADEAQLAELKREDEDPNSEYRQSEAEFKQLDHQWTETKEKVQSLREAGQAAEADAAEAVAKSLRARWQTAQSRFELAIQERKTLREKGASLTKKIQQDRKALDLLTGQTVAEEPDDDEHNANGKAPEHDAGKAAAKSHEHAADTAKHASIAGEAESKSADSDDEQESPLAQELAAAQHEAKLKEAAAKQAAGAVNSVAERLESLRKNIEIEQQLLAIARAKADRAQSQLSELNQELQRRILEEPARAPETFREIATADKRLREARDESRATQSRIDDLRAEASALQEERLAALAQAKRVRELADEAQANVARLQNPFNPQNLLQWAYNHGPKLVTIVLGTLLLHSLSRLSSRQVAVTVARSLCRGTARERQNRAVTLVGVFRNLATLVVLGGGALMALDEVGIPILPLMGGAAVFGLAVAFGAQNLIRDYFSGFMVLMEDQYGINDRVKIGQISGTVEKITLRLTVLRDLDGTVHFIPHGSIATVSNMSHNWSRAVVEVAINLQEDSDYVMSVLMEIAAGLREDPQFGPLIMEEPEMLGLENLSDSAATIRFCVKTHPMQRGAVRRELLRRIKRRFAELGIGLAPAKRPAAAAPEAAGFRVSKPATPPPTEKAA